MKKIYSLMLALATAGLLFSACDKTMGTKDSVDESHAVAAPAVNVSASSVTYNSFVVNVTVDQPDHAFETGVNIGTTSDMNDAEIYISDKVGEAIPVNGLEPETDYYIQGFAYGNGGQAVFTDVTKVTTAEAPSLPLAGTYTATDYKLSNGQYVQDGKPYQVTITLDSDNQVAIMNLQAGGMTINGTYDPETHLISVPTNQTIFVDEDYGACRAWAINDERSAWLNALTFTFKPKGGTMQTSLYAAHVDAGNFGFYKTSMVHDPVE